MNDLKRILIADDDVKDVKLMLKAFEDGRVSNVIDVVHDGEAALDYLYRRGDFEHRGKEHPVVIMLDIKMPKLDGIDVLREIRQSNELRYIPVVMLTSSREEKDIIDSYNLGVNAFVVKPVKFKDFLEVISQVQIFWALINEPPPVARLN